MASEERSPTIALYNVYDKVKSAKIYIPIEFGDNTHADTIKKSTTSTAKEKPASFGFDSVYGRHSRFSLTLPQGQGSLQVTEIGVGAESNSGEFSPLANRELPKTPPHEEASVVSR